MLVVAFVLLICMNEIKNINFMFFVSCSTLYMRGAFCFTTGPRFQIILFIICLDFISLISAVGLIVLIL